VMSYVFVIGWGKDGVAPGVGGQFEGSYGSAWYPLTDRYVGGALTTVFELLIITSSFACAMAFYNTSARYLFSLSREGLLPTSLARTHARHHSPHVSAMVVTTLVATYILGFAIYDSSTEAFFLKLGTWTPLLGVLGILGVQALCCVAIIRYFQTTAKDGAHWWRTLLAPAIGLLGQAGACYLLIDNRGALAGSEVFFVKGIPWFVLATFLGGIAYALYLKTRDAERYGAIGSFEHDDPLAHEHVIAGGPLQPAGA
ncbi:MAG TPA: amino acid permease, partial [Solirubrobacteraceae bacterium]